MQREREFPDGQSPMVPGLDSANVHFKITVGTTATVTKHRVENIRSLNLFVLTRPSEVDLKLRNWRHEWLEDHQSEGQGVQAFPYIPLDLLIL